VPGEQSRKNWGFVRQQGRDPLEIPLVMEAPGDLHAVVPGLAGGWVGGLYTPGDGHADPEKATDAFARADHEVTLDSLRQVRFFLPSYWKNRALFRFHVGRPLLASLAAALPGSAARRRPLVWDRGREPRPNAVKVRRSLTELQRVLPALPPLAIVRAWAGYIDAAPDLVPVLGEVPGLRGLVLATGFSGHGFAMGPIAGRLVSELLVDGKPSLDIAGFRFSRFAEGAIGPPRNVL
jgi:glycine/D-amino acid oxidase-like deaminating enzyme